MQLLEECRREVQKAGLEGALIFAANTQVLENFLVKNLGDQTLPKEALKGGECGWEARARVFNLLSSDFMACCRLKKFPPFLLHRNNF